MTKTDKKPCTCGFYFLEEETLNNMCVCEMCVFDTNKYKGEKAEKECRPFQSGGVYYFR